MFANKHAKILVALVCTVLGFMLTTQFKTTERQKTINVQRAEDLSDRLKVVEDERNYLSTELEKLKAKASDEVVANEIIQLKANGVPSERRTARWTMPESAWGLA